MPKLEFGDFYKFLVSIGIILLAISLVFPWLLIQESYEPVLSDEEFIGIESQTQELLLRRNSIALWILDNLIYIETALLCFGLFLFYLGSRFWFDRQKIRDENEDLEYMEKVKNLGNATLLAKAEEISKDFAEVGVSEKEIEKYNYENFRNYLSTEKTIVSQIERKLPDTYTVFPDKQIQNHILDAVLVARSLQHVDIIIEIKRTKSLSINTIEKAAYQVRENISLYRFEIGRSAAGLLFIVLPNESDITTLQINDFRRLFYLTNKQFANFIYLQIVRENQLFDFDFQKLMNMIQAKFTGFVY